VTQDNITALTPYSAQKEEIKKRLQDEKLPVKISVKTITESQGTDHISLYNFS
jgi:superfamily I DNA and/or RNA helicase